VRAPRLRLGRGGARRRVGAGLALLAAIAVVVVIVLTTGNSPSSPASATNASDTSGGATVERRNLVETDTEAGTLSYSDPQTVYNRLSGTVTWLPSVGQEIRPGGTLYKVDGEPVIMVNGSTPAFREMHSGMSAGADVLQLNRNLVRLGFNPDGIVINDTWQPATTDGVEQFQDSLGESPTGSLPLGQVVFLPGDQLVTTVDGTLGAAGGGSGSPPSSATSTPVAHGQPEFVDLKTVGAAHPEFVSLDTAHGAAVGAASATSSTTASTPTTPTTATTATTSTTTTPSGGTGGQTKKKKENSEGRQTLAALIALLRAEIAQLRAAGHSPQGSPSGGGSPKSSSPKKSSSPGKGSPKGSDGGNGGGGGGGGGGSATAILQTTSTHLVVTVDLDASVQSEAVVGEHVLVQMPAGNTVGGKITAVSSIATSSTSGNNGDNSGGNGGGGGSGGSGGSSSTIPVTVTLAGHHSGAGLDQAAVSVNFAQARANHVLSVPVTALLATSGGNYAVQESAARHKLIPVTTGLFAAGYVQISGSGIYPGLQVTDSQG
jgi:hypothetical protein